jgi:hypothetical protein
MYDWTAADGASSSQPVPKPNVPNLRKKPDLREIRVKNRRLVTKLSKIAAVFVKNGHLDTFRCPHFVDNSGGAGPFRPKTRREEARHEK